MPPGSSLRCRSRRRRLSEEDRLLLAREELLARLTAEISPERRQHSEPRRARQSRRCRGAGPFRRATGSSRTRSPAAILITALIKALLEPTNPAAAADEGGGRGARPTARRSRRQRRRSSRSCSNTWTSPPPRRCRAPSSRRSSPAGSRNCSTETKIQLNFVEQRELVESLIADMLGLGPLEPLLERRDRHRHHGQRRRSRSTSSGAASSS